MGRHCLGRWSNRCWSGSFQTSRKVTARSLCIHPTTQRLYQSAGNAKKPRPEESFASGATNLCLECKVAGSNPERTVFCFSHLQAHNNDCTVQCAYFDACCVQNRVSCGRSCMLIMQDLPQLTRLKFVAEFSLLFEYGTLPFRNIAHGKKRSYIFKKVRTVFLTAC